MTSKPGTIRTVPTISNSLPKASGSDTKIVGLTIQPSTPPGCNCYGPQEGQEPFFSTTLAEGVLNLSLTGSNAIAARIFNLTGNSLDNLINGNMAANELRGAAGNDCLNGQAGNDMLDGGTGRDLLTGGAGADRFRFSTPAGFGMAQADLITDFRSQEGDRLEISRQAFGIASSAVATVVTARNDAELTGMLATGNLFVLDQRDGSLLFNQNGTATGAGSGGVFAVLSGVSGLQASSLALIA